MTDNVPLIFDAQDNRIKELPVGNNLDLTGSGIVNADSMAVNGSLTVNSITINSQSLSTVAFSNNYEDLDNTPTGFTGDYNDLTNKPTVPGILKNLNDVSGDNPVDGDALVYDALEGLYRPQSIVNQTDLDALTLGSLDNVITVGNVTDRFLKFTAGAWRPSKVQYAEVQNTPTAVSAFTNDAGYLTQLDLESGIEITPTGDLTGSVFSDDSTLLVDGVNSSVNLKDTIDDDVVPKEANTVDLGSPSKPFRSLYLSDNTLVLGDYALGINNGKLKLTNPGVDSGAEGFEVLDIFAEFVGVQQGLTVDNNARMDLGSFIQFEEIEQFGTDIGKLGTFADSFIGFTQAGSMILYTGEGAPATSIGEPGTPIGAIAIDSNYIYYCVAEYDGFTDIWRRTPWAESSW